MLHIFSFFHTNKHSFTYDWCSDKLFIERKIMSKDKILLHTVLCQKWEESECGWGTRPDGYSLHIDEASLRSYIASHWASLPAQVPDEYERPDGTPYWCEVDESTYQSVRESQSGARYYQKNYPGSGGVDGWQTLGHGGQGKR